MGLTNIEAIHSRAEDFQSDVGFDVVISRAFSDLSDFVSAARHLCAKAGKLFAMKGLHPFDEIEKLPDWACVVAVKPLKVPRLDAVRHLLVIEVS